MDIMLILTAYYDWNEPNSGEQINKTTQTATRILNSHLLPWSLEWSWCKKSTTGGCRAWTDGPEVMRSSETLKYPPHPPTLWSLCPTLQLHSFWDPSTAAKWPRTDQSFKNTPKKQNKRGQIKSKLNCKSTWEDCTCIYFVLWSVKVPIITMKLQKAMDRY